MKLYQTSSTDDTGRVYEELTTSGATASKARTRLKREGHDNIGTEEVDIQPTRNGIVEFVNTRFAHKSWSEGASDESGS